MSGAAEVKAETPEERIAKLEKSRSDRQKARDVKQAERKIQRLELAEKYEQELGAEASEFFIYDSGHLDDPLVVVKRPALIQWTKYEQSKQTPTDRYEFVVPSVVHPSREAFNALRDKRVGVEIAASNLLARLMGLQGESDAGK